MTLKRAVGTKTPFGVRDRKRKQRWSLSGQPQLRIFIDFLKVVRMDFWSGVLGRGTNDSYPLLARSRFALGARTIALRAHCRATRSKAGLVSKSSIFITGIPSGRKLVGKSSKKRYWQLKEEKKVFTTNISHMRGEMILAVKWATKDKPIGPPAASETCTIWNLSGNNSKV